MSEPATIPDFLELIRQSGAFDAARLDAALARIVLARIPPREPKRLAAVLVGQHLMTAWQARMVLRGRPADLTLGNYIIHEPLGWGGMGVVYLAEHRHLRRWVALKVLPRILARHRWFLEQFYHEARAVAALDHPNIVRANDVGNRGNLHFLVMGYVDGTNLDTIVQKHGPLDFRRAAHYVRQAAEGLQHAFAAGLVHRDIKPANLLLDRRGTVKVLDLGLACFLRDRTEAAQSGNGVRNTVGTDDYLAPEQIVDSDDVDTRADVYGLGATLYFLLTGQAPFEDETLPSQKLVAHLTRAPRPIAQLRPEVPPELAVVVSQMMAKNPWERYQTPAAVAAALEPWCREPIPPPPAEEMPSRRAGDSPADPADASPTVAGASSGKRTWVVLDGKGAAPPAAPKGHPAALG